MLRNLEILPSQNRGHTLYGVLAGAVGVGACSLALACSISGLALAEPGDTTGVMTQGEGAEQAAKQAGESSSSGSSSKNLYGDEKIEVDLLADELKSAKANSTLADIKSCALKLHSDAISARLPEQEMRSEAAARNLYKIQQDRYNVAEMLLSSKSIDDFIRQLDYLHDITQANEREIKATVELQAEMKRTQAAVEKIRDDAEERLRIVNEALKEQQSTRIARAKAGIEKAQTQAVELDGEKSVGTDGAGNKQPSSFRLAATSDASALDDGADWSKTKEEFVSEWAPRIDEYLKGSPLYGQGENFAKSAWKHCIDPRWSAAISNTESSKGSICIRPHNAWGWGAADSDPYNLAAEWGSWAEAIDAHARGLANSYGYTITITGAQTYCPYTWQSWYNRTLTEMAKI